IVKPLIVLLVWIAYAVPASAGRPLARSAPDTGKSLAMMISPLPPPVPPPCEQAAARNAPTSMSEALLSHRLDKVASLRLLHVWRSTLPPRTGRPPPVAPERMGRPRKRQRTRRVHAPKRVGAPLVSGGATRDDSPSNDARAG